MFDGNQIVTVVWNPANKKHYMDLGYEFTKYGEKFEVKASDLSVSSSAIVVVNCDYCGKPVRIKYVTYKTKMQRTLNDKFSCGAKECTYQKNYEVRYKDNLDEKYDEYIRRCEMRDYIPLTKRKDINNVHDLVGYICKKHGYNELQLSSFIYKDVGWGCIHCGREDSWEGLRLSTDEVIKRVESKNNNKVLNPEEYTRFGNSNLKILCGICGDMFITSLASLSIGDGACPKCAIEKVRLTRMLPKSRVKEIIESVNNNKWINQEDYINNQTNNLIILCGACNQNTFTTCLGNYVYNNKTRCNKCMKRTSSGELLISSILDSLGVFYIPEYKFDDCKYKRPLSFDFYLPSYNHCIEFDGELHFVPTYGEERLKVTQLRDEIKNNYCKIHNIGLTRIPYWDGNKALEIIKKDLNIK